MSIDTISSIIYLAIVIIGLISIIISAIIKVKNTIKIKNQANAEINKAQEQVTLLENSNIIIDAIHDAMIQAEQFINYSATEKCEFVKSQIKSICYEKNIDYNSLNADKIIDYFMEIANNINARGTVSKTNTQSNNVGV